MGDISVAVTVFAVIAIACGTSYSQTKCIWIEKSEHGTTTSKIGVSYNVAKVFAGSGGDFDLDGAQVKFDTLLYAYRTGNVVRVPDSTGTGESKIYRGTFDKPMEESTNKRHYLVVENTDSTGAVKVTKLRSESVEAVGVILAMIGSKNVDEDIDRIESVLEPGGILYVRDMKKKSSVWIYIN